MKRIITGASGFIGGYLAKTLLADFPGDQLLSVGQTKPGLNGLLHIQADLTKPSEVNSVLSQFPADEVYHLAGLSSVSDAIEVPQYFNKNTLTTQVLLDAIIESGRSLSFFFTSSVHVYGNQNGTVDEDTMVHPVGPYGYTKYLAEQVIRQKIKGTTVKALVARLYSCIGPGQPGGFAITDLVNKVCKLPNDNSSPLLVGPTSGFRNFLDVRDAARIFPSLLVASGQSYPFEIVNVASANRLQISEAIKVILEVANKSPKIIESAAPPNSFKGVTVSTKKLHRLLPNLTFTPFRKTIEDMCA